LILLSRTEGFTKRAANLSDNGYRWYFEHCGQLYGLCMSCIVV